MRPAAISVSPHPGRLVCNILYTHLLICKKKKIIKIHNRVLEKEQKYSCQKHVFAVSCIDRLAVNLYFFKNKNMFDDIVRNVTR